MVFAVKRSTAVSAFSSEMFFSVFLFVFMIIAIVLIVQLFGLCFLNVLSTVVSRLV